MFLLQAVCQKVKELLASTVRCGVRNWTNTHPYREKCRKATIRNPSAAHEENKIIDILYFIIKYQSKDYLIRYRMWPTNVHSAAEVLVCCKFNPFTDFHSCFKGAVPPFLCQQINATRLSLWDPRLNQPFYHNFDIISLLNVVSTCQIAI